MKTLLKLIVILSLVCFPTSSFAAENPYNYWYCYQVGTIEKYGVFVHSNVWADNLNNHYELREKLFAKQVQKQTKGTFKPSFSVQCLDYISQSRAHKHLKKKQVRSEKSNFLNLEIFFNFIEEFKSL